MMRSPRGSRARVECVISPLVGEMAGRPEGGAVLPTSSLGSSPPPKAGARWPRSGRRGGLRRALHSPSRLRRATSPRFVGRGISNLRTPRSFAPPSALPGISPTRGEIGSLGAPLIPRRLAIRTEGEGGVSAAPPHAARMS
ncbi:MAG: hypothetical protein E5X49_33475 [Mesorhizobium sp.]|nr:MAG: hypothetical protein EOQ28_34125 [Mesorhizobium sp.]RWB92851.1 MAG: hypothetical protein EOQ57_35610 [Mesorhizobium sp.]RWG76074.1 MAG: hypothetical protein EOQ69_32610 [Mesorhizobium sp.]RWG76741.1 MAG: hypothetical protein EOQ70_33105 [Mesorhizobium sp.]RWJ94130.1 MAG: hypothetical protein EOR42_31590 [Mesorhizobium sp.]